MSPVDDDDFVAVVVVSAFFAASTESSFLARHRDSDARPPPVEPMRPSENEWTKGAQNAVSFLEIMAMMMSGRGSRSSGGGRRHGAIAMSNVKMKVSYVK